MPKTVLMCPPTFFEVREIKNPHMGRAIDRIRAQQQWDNLRRAFEDAGLKVEIMDPVEHLEDMVFAANQVFVGNGRNRRRFIVPSRMRHPSRQKEVPFYVDWFSQRGYEVIQLDLRGEYLEGHGDLIWHPDGSRIWAGYGFRSTRGGVERFAARTLELGVAVTRLELKEAHFYHLDTCFNPLNKEAVLLYPAAFAASGLEEICLGFERVHELNREEAMQFVANGVAVNGRFLTPRLTENLSTILAREQLTPVVIDTSEFEKSGGSIFCMKTFID